MIGKLQFCASVDQREAFDERIGKLGKKGAVIMGSYECSLLTYINFFFVKLILKAESSSVWLQNIRLSMSNFKLVPLTVSNFRVCLPPPHGQPGGANTVANQHWRQFKHYTWNMTNLCNVSNSSREIY